MRFLCHFFVLAKHREFCCHKAQRSAGAAFPGFALSALAAPHMDVCVFANRYMRKRMYLSFFCFFLQKNIALTATLQ